MKITRPDGGIYLFGNKTLDFGPTVYIDKLEIEVEADDGPDVGIKSVFFSYDGGSGYDDNSSDGRSDVYNHLHFGNLTVTVRAMDNKEQLSKLVSKTITVYNLGFL
ncbi:MAG: hypothetical protein V5A68_05795 [Candidatus Thermoplasmatota archaeon]